jgi:hypothetical protein
VSVHASAWAWQAPGDLTPHELLLLVALADYANERGQAWPSMATLARRCHLHRATIFRLLTRLEEHHKLIVAVRSGGGRHGRSNVYQLQMSAPRYPRELAEHEQITALEDGSHGATRVDKPVAPDAIGSHRATRREMRQPVAPDATGGVAPDATRSVSEPSITITHARALHVGEFGELCEHLDLGDGTTIEIPPQPDRDAYKLPDDQRAVALAGVRAIKAQLATSSHGSDRMGA